MLGYILTGLISFAAGGLVGVIVVALLVANRFDEDDPRWRL